MLPSGFTLVPHNLPLTAGTHPLYLAFNQQAHCAMLMMGVSLEFIWMPTYKENIAHQPFVLHPRLGGPMTYKSRMFLSDAIIMSMSVNLVYAMNAVWSTMSADSSRYHVKYEQKNIESTLHRTQPAAWFNQTFGQMNTMPWLVERMGESCAFNQFVFGSEPSIKPISMNIKMAEGPNMRAHEWTVTSNGGNATTAAKASNATNATPGPGSGTIFAYKIRARVFVGSATSCD